MDIDVLHGTESLGEIRPEWDRLVAASARPRPTLTYGWLEASRRAAGSPGADGLFTLCFRDDGRLVGLVPLGVRALSIAGVTVARDVQFATGAADCRDLVVEAGFEWGVAEAFMQWLREAPLRWDLVRLRGLSSLSPTRVYLPLLARHADLRTTVWGADTSAAIRLPQSMAEYLHAMPSRGRRRTYAYNHRRLSREHAPPNLRVVEGGDITDADVQKVWELHCQVWGERGGTVTTAPAFLQFLRELVTALPPAARPMLAFLRVGERDVTGDLCFVMGERCFLYFGGLDRGFAPYSVGNQALLALIEHGIERGWTEIDLMGGGEQYKYSFTRIASDTADLWVARTGGLLRLATALAALRGQAAA